MFFYLIYIERQRDRETERQRDRQRERERSNGAFAMVKSNGALIRSKSKQISYDLGGNTFFS